MPLCQSCKAPSSSWKVPSSSSSLPWGCLLILGSHSLPFSSLLLLLPGLSRGLVPSAAAGGPPALCCPPRRWGEQQPNRQTKQTPKKQTSRCCLHGAGCWSLPASGVRWAKPPQPLPGRWSWQWSGFFGGERDQEEVICSEKPSPAWWDPAGVPASPAKRAVKLQISVAASLCAPGRVLQGAVLPAGSGARPAGCDSLFQHHFGVWGWSQALAVWHLPVA